MEGKQTEFTCTDKWSDDEFVYITGTTEDFIRIGDKVAGMEIVRIQENGRDTEFTLPYRNYRLKLKKK